MDPWRITGHPARDGVPWGGNRTTVGAGVVSELHDRRNWGRHALGLGRVIGAGGSHRGRTMGIEFGQLGIVPRRPTVLRSNRSGASQHTSHPVPTFHRCPSGQLHLSGPRHVGLCTAEPSGSWD